MIEISVVIPTYNRREQLRHLLELLAGQTYPASKFEVVVSVDGSIDGTSEMLEGLRTPYALQPLHRENGGHAAAVNAGIAAARGVYCILLDDDILPAPGLIAAHALTMVGDDRTVSIGAIPTVVPGDAGWFAREFAREMNGHYERLGQGRQPLWTDCYSGNVGISRRLLEEVGEFRGDIGWGDDIELGYRLEQSGARFVYTPEAVGTQDERKGAAALLKSFEAQGAAAVEIHRRHPGTIGVLARDYHRLGPRSHRLRTACLALGVPPTLPVALGSMMAAGGRREKLGRFARSLAYWRGVRRQLNDAAKWRQLTRGTPILMYHAFAGRGESAGRYIVPIWKFRVQMALIRLLRYRVIGLGEYVDSLRRGELIPGKTVVITIDDGYADNHSLAFPTLRRYGYPATIFVVTERMGGKGNWDRDSELSGRPLMGWEEVREMSAAGIEFGAHTRTHPRLTSLSPAEAKAEIEGSKLDLASELGMLVRHFAYPYGECDDEVAGLAEGASFNGTCGVRSGLNRPGADIHRLNRTEVFGTDTPLIFAAKLRSGNTDALGAKRRRPEGIRNADHASSAAEGAYRKAPSA